ncbi:MAG: tetratricopeptide repeat protein [Thermodesulfobacteriota bacterium]
MENESRISLSIHADQQYEYAEYCFSNRFYFEAISEFRRFIFFFPQDARIKTSAHRIGMSYYHLGEYNRAISVFLDLAEKRAGIDDRLFIDAQHMISKSYQALGNPGQAVITLFNLISASTDISIKDEAYFRIGWIYLEMAEWGKARTAFEKISPENQVRYEIKRISTEMEAGKAFSRKNPELAGLFSLIPGAGYLYCGRYQDALISLVLNGALFYAAVEAFDQDSPALGGLLTVAGLSFYTGSIYGTISSVHKYNRNQTRRFIENLKREMNIGIIPLPEKNGLLLSLQYRF